MKLLAATLFVFLALGSCLCNGHYASAQTEPNLQAANTAVGQAFNAVLDAEKAGGNVSSLLTQLNTAESFLTEAETAYNNGNNATADTKANQASNIAQSVQSQALALKSKSASAAQNNFELILTFFVGGSVVFVLLIFLIWRKVKGTYIEKMLKSKPANGVHE